MLLALTEPQVVQAITNSALPVVRQLAGEAIPSCSMLPAAAAQPDLLLQVNVAVFLATNAYALRHYQDCPAFLSGSIPWLSLVTWTCWNTVSNPQRCRHNCCMCAALLLSVGMQETPSVLQQAVAAGCQEGHSTLSGQSAAHPASGCEKLGDLHGIRCAQHHMLLPELCKILYILAC